MEDGQTPTFWLRRGGRRRGECGARLGKRVDVVEGGEIEGGKTGQEVRGEQRSAMKVMKQLLGLECKSVEKRPSGVLLGNSPYVTKCDARNVSSAER